MSKYLIDFEYVFSVTYTVEALSKADAIEKIEKHCGCVLSEKNIHSNLPDNEIDWDFYTHPTKSIIKKVISKDVHDRNKLFQK